MQHPILVEKFSSLFSIRSLKDQNNFPRTWWPNRKEQVRDIEARRQWERPDIIFRSEKNNICMLPTTVLDILHHDYYDYEKDGIPKNIIQVSVFESLASIHDSTLHMGGHSMKISRIFQSLESPLFSIFPERFVFPRMFRVTRILIENEENNLFIFKFKFSMELCSDPIYDSLIQQVNELKHQWIVRPWYVSEHKIWTIELNYCVSNYTFVTGCPIQFTGTICEGKLTRNGIQQGASSYYIHFTPTQVNQSWGQFLFVVLDGRKRHHRSIHDDISHTSHHESDIRIGCINNNKAHKPVSLIGWGISSTFRLCERLWRDMLNSFCWLLASRMVH